MNVRDLQLPVFGAPTDQTDVRIWLRNDDRNPMLVFSTAESISRIDRALRGRLRSLRLATAGRHDRHDQQHDDDKEEMNYNSTNDRR